MNEAGYAQSQGMRMLKQVVEAIGPLFTVEQVRSVAISPSTASGEELTPQRINYLLSQLAQAGWIERIKQGMYAVRAPFLGSEIHPYALAAALVSPIAISHWSALAYHGLTTQIPPMVQASTTAVVVTPEMRRGAAYRPRGHAAWRALGLEFEFIHVHPERFFGFQEEWVSQWHRVQITDRERTMLDLFASPQVFGSLQTGLETLETYRGQIDLSRLVAYALRYAVGATIKRLGWALETLGTPEHTLAPLRAYPVRAWAQLDPAGPPGGTPLSGWKLRNNLYSEVDDAQS